MIHHKHQADGHVTGSDLTLSSEDLELRLCEESF